MKDVLLGRDQEVLAAVAKAGSAARAAPILGVHKSSVSRALKRIAAAGGSQPSVDTGSSLSEIERSERGLNGYEPVLEGYAIKETTTVYDADGEVERTSVKQSKAPGSQFVVPKGQIVKGVSALLDPNDREILKWVKTGLGSGPSIEDTIERLKTAFLDYTPARRTRAPKATSDNLLTLFPMADWHVGMRAWGKETGTNWDLKIAEEVLGDHAERTIDRSPPSDVCVILGGGDLLHADNQENRTARSGNQLDVDGRHDEVHNVADRLVARVVDTALLRHKRVILRILKGNHDPQSSVAVAYFMKAYYRNEPRVTVDVDPSLFFFHQFGKVMLAATHGHETKFKDLSGVMSARRAVMWGQTEFRYGHTFHLHHQRKLETGGAIIETHRAPIPQDSWHYGAGFLSGREMQAITYHKAFGETGRVTEILIDTDVNLLEAA